MAYLSKFDPTLNDWRTNTNTTMNTKHTPGPWMVTVHNHIKCDLRPIGLTADAGQTLASVVGGPTSGLSFPQSADEVSANARLIAAAPLMYERLVKEIGQAETDKLLGY